MSPDDENSLLGADIASVSDLDMSQDSRESRKRKNLNTSWRSHKRAKLCSTPCTSSTESLNEENLTQEGWYFKYTQVGYNYGVVYLYILV